MSRLPVVQERAGDAGGDGGDGARATAAARFRVEGMDCAACARTLERVVGSLDGVDAAEVSFGAATLHVRGAVPADRVVAAVSAAGYRAHPVGTRTPAHAGPGFWLRDRRARSALAGIALLAVAVVLDLAGARRAAVEPVYLLATVVAGWAVARAAWTALRRRSLDMNVLMALAAIGAVCIGAYAEAAWVLVLFAIGTTLETYALDRTRRSVASLVELVPATALVVDGAAEVETAVDAVPVGATIAVRPGDRLPLDGDVVSGTSSVDESPITGESLPVDKAPGDSVFAGTLNQFGALRVRTTHDAAASTISRIVELVEQAQGTRAPSERLVDRFARVYTPLVFLAAVVLGTVPVLLGGDADTWIYRALALLIVACPCSLVISIPVAVVSAIGAAARRGVLVKGGEALEDLARIRVVALDKTGTLTLGTPELVEIVAVDAVEDDALGLAATVERRSEHPLARAVVRAAEERGLRMGEPQRWLALPGLGVDALVDGRAVWAGGPRLAADRLGEAHPEVAAMEARGRSVIALGSGSTLLALFGLADAARADAPSAVDGLRRRGVEQIVMLTGDTPAVAAAVADQAGVDEWHASLVPAEKLAHVRELERAYGAVAMVGDGVNDAPALAGARVGVAMGAAGTGVALDAADVALLQDDLGRLPEVIALAQRARGVMRQNVVASLLVKGTVVVLVPFGLVPLWLAVAADMGMSLLVTLNALRLLRRPHPGTMFVSSSDPPVPIHEALPTAASVELAPEERESWDGCRGSPGRSGSSSEPGSVRSRSSS